MVSDMGPEPIHSGPVFSLFAFCMGSLGGKTLVSLALKVGGKSRGLVTMSVQAHQPQV